MIYLSTPDIGLTQKGVVHLLFSFFSFILFAFQRKCSEKYNFSQNACPQNKRSRMMKRITISILFIILTLGLVCNAYAQTAYNLWPMKLGNQWTYKIEGRINDGNKFKVEVTQKSGGWAYLDAIDEFYGTGWGDRWWWTSYFTGYIWTWDYGFSRVFNLAVGKGNHFKSRMKGVPCQDDTVWMVADDDATVNTYIGTFDGCIVINNVQPVCADAGLTQMIFAPKVGLIEYSWTTFAGGHTAKLIHAIVNGIEYKRIEYTGGYSVGLNIDKITYTLTENRMPPVPPEGPPQRPDTLKVKMKIENETSETVTFTHSSSQEYDFIIRDESGTEVYRWSSDKAFLTVIVKRTLGPGESLVYEEAIELRDNDKKPIEPGNYTIEGLHTTMVKEALRQRARLTFNIDLAIVY
jgi:hypothetical protein